jgi:hypothetical protein
MYTKSNCAFFFLLLFRTTLFCRTMDRLGSSISISVFITL